MTDYLIVGCGLAGIAFAETVLNANRTLVVYDNASTRSSLVAAGIFNPVILKRFSGLANAQEQLDEMNSFYDKLESKLGSSFRTHAPLYRKFASVGEQNFWFEAVDKPLLKGFLKPEVLNHSIHYVDAPNGYGEVLQTGYVGTAALVSAYQEFIKKSAVFVCEAFDYDQMTIADDCVTYKGNQFRNVIFAEGFGIRKNPFFNYLPLNGTKGELLIIYAPDLDLKAILNSSLFILPIGNHYFKVGATYNWDDKTELPTEDARLELLNKLSDIITCPFAVTGHLAGIRPTVKDRKPLIGTHPKYPNIHLLNGLGTRGVMLAPYVAKLLYNHIESDTEIPESYDLNRFVGPFLAGNQ